MTRLAALVALLVGSMVVALTPGAALTSDGTATAELDEFRDSGVTAIINFTDTGSQLIVEGEAWGLIPGQTYVSLIYDNGSVPDGTFACEPSPPDAGFNQLTFDQMLLGQWTHTGDGTTGTLKVVKTGAGYAALDKFLTVSVRQFLGPPPPPPQPPPNRRVACGEVVTD